MFDKVMNQPLTLTTDFILIQKQPPEMFYKKECS